MSKSLISADGSSRASPPWKVCFRRRWRVPVRISLMLYPPLDEVCAFEMCVVLCVFAWPWLPGPGRASKCLLCDKLKRGSAPPKCLLCDNLMWLSRSWGWLVHCLSVYHLPAWEMGPWLWPWPDYIIMFVLCVRWVRARVDYIVMCLPCDVLIRLG